jgi:hypothetical protein
VAYEINTCKLEHRSGLFGDDESRLTLKGLPEHPTVEQVQQKVKAAFEEINLELTKLPGLPKVGWKIYESGNNDLAVGCIECVPLLREPEAIDRLGARKVNDEERGCPEQAIRRSGLSRAPNDAVRLIAGLFRLWKGFPEDIAKIGTPGDFGDVLKGRVVRTQEGRCSASVTCRPFGVIGYLCVLAYNNAGVAVTL